MTVILDKTDSQLCESVIDEATRGYMMAALWVGSHYATTDTGDGLADYDPLDDHFRWTDLPTDLVTEAREDVKDFVCENWADVTAYLLNRDYDPSDGSVGEHLGHDFLLTRNGHGAGFWDRGLGDLGERLSSAARAYSGHNLTSYGLNAEGDPSLPIWEG